MTKTKIKVEEIDIDDVIAEYAEDDDVFNEEKPITKHLKYIIFNKLDEVDRRVILLYAELQSLRKLGKILGVSASSAYIKIRQIKDKIKDALDKSNTDS